MAKKLRDQYDAIVIGAGCGGVTVASLLAKKGRDVLLLEQGDFIGGCCSTFEKKGFRFDAGASILEDIEIIDQVYQRLGSSLAKEVKLKVCDPVYDVLLSDGSKLRIPLDSDKTADEIAHISPGDGRRWKKYARRLGEFLDTALRGFFVMPANTLGDMLRIFKRTPALLKFGTLFAGSYQGLMQRYFKDKRILESMSFQSFYVGLPPALAPAYFAMLPYSEHRGVYYPEGGMGRVPEGILRLGKKTGLEVALKTAVAKILVKNRKAYGVELADGRKILSSVVVSGINAKSMYQKMIGHEHLPWIVRAGLKSYEYSMATPMIYLGLDYRPPLTAHHTLVTIPTAAMNRYWYDYYKKGIYPKEQFGIICWPTFSDPGMAPRGKHILILTLAPGPYRLKDKNWDEVKEELMAGIIDYYSNKYIPGLKEHVRVAEFSTPLDFERRLLSPEGAIYALRQDVTNASVFRPAARSKSIRNLYLVGASTHPGGGVPTTIASGMIGADLIEADLAGRKI